MVSRSVVVLLVRHHCGIVSVGKHEISGGCAHCPTVVICMRRGHIFLELSRCYKNSLLAFDGPFEGRLLAVGMQLQ
jgi:hypothetical protein